MHALKECGYIWNILNLWFEVDEAEVFSDDSMLREYNYLVGYLQVLFSMDKLVSSFHDQSNPCCQEVLIATLIHFEHLNSTANS